MEEVLLYGQIYSESSIDFITAINAVEGDNLIVRLNTPGGDVNHGWGMVAKFMEFPGSKVVKVDGSAFSMGFNFCLYADSVEALDVSQFMVHRAAYSQWYEENYMTEQQKENLISVNANLEKALRNKIDVAKFEEIKGVKIKDIFSMEG
ncbi:MAG: ATP-dependent Clp protease proteolytic subunit, partial [Nanoarchaeota archaeon]|nr:ATP-dependent Clp protease proteolytic subunit [Nanoarchaeota archaeon]